ncbi:hypothetical protein THAOC_27191, partial [Thalassiosira oceanica]
MSSEPLPTPTAPRQGDEVDVFGRPLVSSSGYEGISSGGNSITSGYLASLKFLEEEVIEHGEYTRLALLKRMQGTTRRAEDEVIDPKAAKELDDTVRNISLSDALDGIDVISAEPAVPGAAEANSTTFELPHLLDGDMQRTSVNIAASIDHD